MLFKRINELEDKVKELEQQLKIEKINYMLMEKYINENDLADDYNKMVNLQLNEAQAHVLRRKFKIVNTE
ncbi:hypothetical protein [Metabacillus fastidiosus]|uniref:hypothetical protein n=1 Tax=Metabacillus fastidiosus TaxID=1458 RepID=UPI003D2C1869